MGGCGRRVSLQDCPRQGVTPCAKTLGQDEPVLSSQEAPMAAREDSGREGKEGGREEKRRVAGRREGGWQRGG